MKFTDNDIDDFIENTRTNKSQKVTDKHGILLLMTIFVIWVASCGYVTCNGLYPIAQNADGTLTNATKLKQYFMNNKWLFDVLTYEYPPCYDGYRCFPHSYFGVLLFSGYYNLGILAVLFWVLSFIKFLERKHYITFYTGLIIISIGYMAVSAVYRIALNIVSDLIPNQLCYKKFVFWMIPEFILCSLILLTVICTWLADPHYACHKFKRTFWWCYKMYCTIIFAVALVAIIISIKIFTTGLIADMKYTNFLLYVIIGGSCYIAFFIYNFGNAVVAFVIWHTINENGGPFKTLLQATIFVIKYHVGSVAFRATIFLPLLVIWRERSNIKRTLEANIDKKFGVRIQSELERSKLEPDSEVIYYKSCPPSPFNSTYWDIDHVLLYFQNHYIVQVFKSSLILVVVHSMSIRDSIKTILLRHSMDQKLPSSTIFILGWPYIYLLLLVISELFRLMCMFFEIETYNVPYLFVISTVAYSKIAIAVFLLGMMLMNNWELTIDLHNIECNERCQKQFKSASANI